MNKIAKVAFLAIAAISSAVAAPAAAQSPALFNTVEYRSNDLDVLPQWKKAMHKIAKEQKTYAASSSKAVRAWQGMIKANKGERQIDQLKAVNNFINQWRYRTDSYNYKTSDYWASPAEFFSRSGDCEDYAIAKYVTLRQMGFSADQLRLVVVKDLERDLAHAVLAAYVDGDVFILDNVNNQVRSQAAVTEYAPYYSVNEQSRWAHAAAPANVASAAGLFSKS
ncbi:MAG: transglutaminase-like cysteine peptidase [Alphaproteobacteria bacterium]|nr:transglutaminase-like cysteine peptidase [Alphaproteobacteria bacterium]